MDYYYLLLADGEQSGPHSLDQVRSLWNANSITVNTMTWSEGMEDWRPLGTIEEIMRPGSREGSAVGMGQEPSRPNRNPRVDEAPENQITVIESEMEEIFYTGIAHPSLLSDASPTSTSKIMVGIECMRREEYEKALNLFYEALGEVHTVASGWLGVAWSEAYLTSIERRTLENIRHAITKAHQFSPAQYNRISNHHGAMLCYALGQSVALAGLSYGEYLKEIASTQSHRSMQQRASGEKAVAIMAGSIAGVLGSRSKGALGAMLGYGIAAKQVFRAANANTAANQFQTLVAESVNRSQAFYNIALGFRNLVLEIIKEAQRIPSSCSPKMRSIIDDTIKSRFEMLISIENEVKQATSSSRIEMRQANRPFLGFVIITFVCILLVAIVAVGLMLSKP